MAVNLGFLVNHAPSKIQATQTKEVLWPYPSIIANTQLQLLQTSSQVPAVMVVATRKISFGEEITMDYGSGYWEAVSKTPNIEPRLLPVT